MKPILDIGIAMIVLGAVAPPSVERTSAAALWRCWTADLVQRKCSLLAGEFDVEAPAPSESVTDFRAHCFGDEWTGKRISTRRSG